MNASNLFAAQRRYDAYDYAPRRPLICRWCQQSFPQHDLLGHESHEHRCKPLSACNEYERAWRNNPIKSGYYRDSPYE